MCGFAGFLDRSRGLNLAGMRAIVRRQATTLESRGPDDLGEWADAAAGVALGFRRLSIMDLSPAGHQPMESASGRHVIVFNGEVYNAAAIGQQLTSEGFAPVWRGHSDTEVMLAAIEAWGLLAATKRFIGMFAFALWDRKERLLHLVRDRMGVKPLYYGWSGHHFLFGSELKALRIHPAFSADLDRDALALFLRHNYIPAPHSIYKGYFKLIPGNILTVSQEARGAEKPQAYWTARSAAESGTLEPFTGSLPEAVERLDVLLRDAIGLRMIADVPLGAFLSGGIDSSLVTAVMQKQSGRPVKTFTIGFYEDAYNEAHHACAVARHLGTDHTELYVTPQQTLDVIPKLPTLYDEPFADSSQIPTYLVAALARQSVTVCLSGDGGDELFGGYSRYFLGRSIWNRIRWMPGFLRNMLPGMIQCLSPEQWDSLFAALGFMLPGALKQRNIGDKLSKLAEVLNAGSPDVLYQLLVSHWKTPAALVIGATEPLSFLTDPKCKAELTDFTQRMMYFDQITYLPDDILVKVDRASMGVSLECREPLLDHRLVEFAWRLPLELKIRHGQGKWLLRQVLDRYVPRELVERPKTGFGIPLASWLRTSLRDWAEALLDEQRLRREGIFHPESIRAMWAEHLTGHRNRQYYLWDILMFQAWCEQQVAQVSHADANSQAA